MAADPTARRSLSQDRQPPVEACDRHTAQLRKPHGFIALTGVSVVVIAGLLLICLFPSLWTGLLSVLRLLLGVFAGTGCGGGGESSFALVGPARAEIGPAADHEGCLLLVGEEVGLEGGQVEGCAADPAGGDPGLGALSGSAELAEGD